MATKPKQWPKNAENARLESIAHANKIRVNQKEIADELSAILKGQGYSPAEIKSRVSQVLLRVAETSMSATEILHELREAKGGNNDHDR